MSTTKMPERIWATLNGMSTRLPDGKRQFIGGWSEDPERGRVTEYIRADLVKEAAEALKKAQGFFEDMAAANRALMVPDGVEVNAFAASAYDAADEVRAALSKLKEAGL